MTDVSRETSVNDGVVPFLDILTGKKPVVKWLEERGVALHNVYLSLVPYLLYLMHQQTKSSLLCTTESSSVAIQLAEQLIAISPECAGSLTAEIPVDYEGALSDKNLLPLHDQQTVNRFLLKDLSFLIAPVDDVIGYELFQLSTDQTTLRFKNGERVSLKFIRDKLSLWGYERVNEVTLPGSFTVRGGIVDIYPMGFSSPVRIELLGNKVHTFRLFDPLSQRMLPESPPVEIVLHQPTYLKMSSGSSSRFISTVPEDTLCFFVRSCGPKQLYDILPSNHDSKRDLPSIDLHCLSHGPFNGNKQAFSEEVSYVNKIQEVTLVLFADAFYSNLVINKKIFKNFLAVFFPFTGSFSSVPLSLFCASLDSVYQLPKPVPSLPTRDTSKIKRPLAVLQPDDLIWGSPVVHEDFGVGLYRGLTTVGHQNRKHECISIEYAGGDRVHVPFDRMSRVHTYVGSSNKAPRLSSLGSTRWKRAKQQTRRSAEKVVDDFIQLYADRHKAVGFRFSPDTDLHLDLKRSFSFEETVDQLTAYEEIKNNMEREKPMDRLICGDVGFGKTEVAVRATFKAVYDKKQVAVLSPTTILADQHYITFKSRLSPLGVRISLLSRFTPTTEKKLAVQGLQDGSIDVVVGTHRLLSDDIHFSDLGLLIIDEEHRFGAKQKEQIKRLRAELDVLTMSATPIPRTLQLSLLGIRDVSSLMTPPKERLPVITTLASFSDATIKRGVLPEIERGGQVFFVHDNVKTIHALTEFLRSLLPPLTFGIAHGQLPGKTLESVMVNFLDMKIDVLVCTTIIEAGIDLPNVNTIFINNAHRFGLSQIHQMRGRVGRSARQAYCYLLIPKQKKLTATAHDRLRTIEYYSTLGSGYALALKDLEMRGAGNLFGVEQSGHVSSVGFHLFCKIVESAAKERLKRPKTDVERPAPLKISFKGSAIISDSYVPDVADRLHFYRRLSTATELSDIEDVRDEIGDRFGLLPVQTLNLIDVAFIQVRAKNYGLKMLALSANAVTGSFVGPTSKDFLLAFSDNLRQRLSSLGVSIYFSSSSGDGLEFSLTWKDKDAREVFNVTDYLFDSIQATTNF